MNNVGASSVVRKLLVLLILATGFSILVFAEPSGGRAQSIDASPVSTSGQEKSEENPKEAFRLAMEQTKLPGDGCFIAKYPERKWLDDKCVTPPEIPMEPHSQPSSPFTVGGSNDFSALVNNTAHAGHVGDWNISVCFGRDHRNWRHATAPHRSPMPTRSS